ncbi:MAG: hypothetical protein AB7P49_12305, partial [Bdellovibrionales bacterium]
GQATHFLQQGGRNIIPAVGSTTHYSPQFQRHITMPYLWQFDIPGRNGGMRPMRELLDNLLVLRGINTFDSSHRGSQQKMTLAAGAAASLHGMVADYTSVSLPAVVVDDPLLPYLSARGSSVMTLGTGGGVNVLKTALGAFENQSTDAFETRIDELEPYIQAAVQSVESRIAPYSLNLVRDRRNAEDMIREGVSGLDQSWNDLVTKYQDLITRSFAMVIPGLNDAPVGAPGPRDGRYQFQAPNDIIGNPDLRTALTPDSGVAGLAQNFAVAEYCLTRGFTKSMALTVGAVGSLGLEINGTFSPSHYFGHDHHYAGVYPTTFFSAFLFVALSSCLLELIDIMRATPASNGLSLFDESVIHVAGEFNRKTRVAMDGSDHAWEAQSVSLISGAIKGLHVVGSIYNKTPNPNEIIDYPGTWGYAAPVGKLGNSPVTTGHTLSSVAYLLRVPNPNPATIPVIQLDPDGSVVSMIGPPGMVHL